MNLKQKRALLVNKVLSRKQKNYYSQDADKRTKIESGYGDCSGTMWYWYKKIFGIDIGTNTEAQIKSKLGKRVDLVIKNGIPDESKMREGDLLYFRGTDNSRTEGVGHVEMYIGNHQIFGHGSGKGGTVKTLNTYCASRQRQGSTSKLKNKGLICVIRFLNDPELEELTEINDIVWEFLHRDIISDGTLWCEKAAQERNNTYWLLRKSMHYIREKEFEHATKAVSANQLEKHSDNVWELAHRKIISNSDFWIQKGTEDTNIYWLIRKLVHYIRKNNI